MAAASLSDVPARITDPEQLKELLGIPFTPEQTACITAPPAPQVIVAGAGSGKTTVMAARVVWLVGTGQVAPEQVLGLTFTNKAAGELAERVRKALVKAGITDPDVIDPDNPPGEPVISTYHAFAGRLLTDHGLRIGLEPTARLLADATRYQLAARVLREAPGPYPALTRSFPDLVGDLLTLDSELAEHLVRPEELRAYDAELLSSLEGAKLSNAELRKIPETAAARRELADLVVRYRAAKRERDLLDFGDQIALSATLARTRAEVGAILRDEFRVVLLDEYQDTSVAQRVLLAGLFGGGTGHPVTAVGDPCQAIYGWRGASVANLDDFPEHFAHADGRLATRQALSENRRSGGRLLDLANGLAEPLRALHAGVEALRPAPGAEHDGQVRCALLRTHAEEIDWIADSLAHLVRTGKEPGEIAVLCRTATDFAEIQGALVARDVPVEVVGLSGLLHLPEVADLVAVCEVLQDPGANASLVRLLTGPRWRIGPRDLALLGRRARLLVSHARVGADDDPDRRLAAAVEGVDPSEVISLADALDTFLEAPLEDPAEADDGLPFSADARVRFARLAAELRDLRRSLADPLMDVLHRVLAVTGLEVELSASPHALAARRRETLSNFLDVAASFAASDGEATLLAFLGFLRTAAQYEKGLDNALPGGENTVKVLTAHKSKGLEWDVVAVPGLVTGTFPSTQGREKWTAQGKVLPHELRGDADTLPDIEAWDSRGMKAFHEAMKEHQHTEELRLGYVTFTRPAPCSSAPATGGARPRSARGVRRTSCTPCTSTARPGTARSRRGRRSPRRTRRTRPCTRRPPTTPGHFPSTTRRWPAAGRPPRPYSPTWSESPRTRTPTPRRPRPSTTRRRTTTRTGRHRRTPKAPTKIPSTRPTAISPTTRPPTGRTTSRRKASSKTTATTTPTGSPGRRTGRRCPTKQRLRRLVPTRRARRPSRPRKHAPSPPGTATWTPSPESCCAPARASPTCPCRRR
ncbi:hypothetical protein SAV31267_064030 [Streptomyces avermitilis]|uniref:DNA 3'-5' helicase n=1 Tax=Streptomyces avermitilis TaxID=33903 RepID=A0A4D4MXK7_STRAX|nr:hypothetical protein SAV31267_064030 [Streptomyces avermitilis]